MREPTDRELRIVKDAVSHELGDISSLPLSLRNGIANIYLWQLQNGKTDLISDGQERAYAQYDHCQSMLELLPDLVKNLTQLRVEDEVGYKVALVVVEALVRYGIQNATKKTLIGLRVRMALRSPLVDELGDLWGRLITI